MSFSCFVAVVEEERSRRLGELGAGWWGTAEDHAGAGEETCGGFFAKKRRSTSQELGTTLPGEVAFAPTHVSRFATFVSFRLDRPRNPGAETSRRWFVCFAWYQTAVFSLYLCFVTR